MNEAQDIDATAPGYVKRVQPKNAKKPFRYFWIAQGLRGCYMPDSSYMIRVKTRRELRDALEWEARDIREAFDAGAGKKAIRWLAAQVWRDRKASLPYVAPYGNRSGKSVNYCFAIHCGNASRAEYREYEESNNG